MEWSKWRPFPDPRQNGLLTAPYGAGCYDLRHRATKQEILFGVSANVAARMSSILPIPHGVGKRDNYKKRDYVFLHLSDIEYRTIAFTTRLEAVEVERKLKTSGEYLFLT